MFNEFEGNADERLAKQEERLRLLKSAREVGYFNEEGTEEVKVYAAGINPCDLGIITFTGEQPFRRPKGVTAPLVRDKDGRPLLGADGRLLRDKRGTMECTQCEGLGCLEPAYGDSAMLERCVGCGGSGRVATPSCLVCGGQGRGQMSGNKACAACDGLWK